MKLNIPPLASSSSNAGQLATLDITTFVANLRLQLVLPHNPGDTKDATSFAGHAQFPMNPGAAIGGCALHIELLD